VSRKYFNFHVRDKALIKQQMLSWANRFNICCFMDNHDYESAYHSFDCLLGIDAVTYFEPADSLDAGLDRYIDQCKDWIFGHFNYDFKQHLQPNPSKLIDLVGFPQAFVFVPRVLIRLVNDELVIGVHDDDANTIYNQICAEVPGTGATYPNVQVKARFSPAEYIETVKHLLEHIHRGDCYEINFCQEFYAQDVIVNPLLLYAHLAALSPNPFCTYYKLQNRYLLCASPERFLKKIGNKLIAQPIKGTWSRNLTDEEQDSRNKQALTESEKDKSENVMVVDLVRNDLSKVCTKGTVQVEELFGIYTFPQVYQMISTVVGRVESNVPFSKILQATFPMGSMTGAPKVKVLKLIEHHEKTRRGIFSGAVGYFTPEKDFDFNVVIRSLMYNGANRYLSYHVGGGITSRSIPENEYDECVLKAVAINKVLNIAPGHK